ncbi:transcription termination factor MTEF1, chloroplastic isoform X2 [Beta vulgaris subsp. vulgaris]|uniref:transcription termination factor MTEF1, chloroplastic isoform X2 n=1 Tax=Beta vulgaris subsp. vulgaris TaxID=3555 RepID=UPI002036B1E3|nr:transcription termination factor MTEF1, chloroplastic isoform X2 [Beta vulgaris subsp. vulgaris]
MQDTLNFRTTTGKPLTPPSNPTFPLKPPNFPSFSHRKTATKFLSSKTTTIPPLKPSQTPPKNNLIPTSPDPEFQAKFLFLDSIGLDSLSLLPPSAIAAAPSLSDLKSSFDYLTSLGFSPPQLRRIFTMCPEILSLRFHDTAPVFAFLLREVKVPASDLPRVICSRPRLLVSDVETRLRPTLYFLQSIGIHEVNRHTNLLSASVEDKYMPKIHYFEKLGFAYHDCVSMFRRFPPLFCYSVKENFEPKFNYFVVEMGRDLKELKAFPQYFSFSLEKRIKPRHQTCVETGVCFPLPLMLKMKENEFRKRLDVCCNSSMPKSNSPLWVY